jgi:transposase
MSKLSYEDKINIYQERKNGKTRIYLSKKYSIGKDKIDYLTRLIDKHGFDILRTTKNRKFNYYEKEQIINRVLINGESVWSVSIDEGLLSSGMLFNWIKEYKENCYNIVERKRGRPTMDKKIKPINKEETQEEKIKRLEKENLYLKAELEYSKKLRAVVQARKNLQQKKK